MNEDTTVQTPAEPTDAGYTYADINEKDVREIASEPEKVEPKEVETPEEKPEAVETPPAPLVDIEEVTKRAAQEAAEKVVEEQERVRKDAEERAQEKKSAAQEYLEESQKNGKEPTWEEAMAFLEERASKRAIEALKQEQEAKERAIQEQTAEQERIRAEEDKKLSAYIDDEMEELYKANKLTRIKDPTNPSDQGVIERQELFKRWQEVNAERRAAGQSEIISAVRIHDFYYKKPSNQPAGSDAPISQGSNASQRPTETPEYSYADLKKPWSFFGVKRG